MCAGEICGEGSDAVDCAGEEEESREDEVSEESFETKRFREQDGG